MPLKKSRVVAPLATGALLLSMSVMTPAISATPATTSTSSSGSDSSTSAASDPYRGEVEVVPGSGGDADTLKGVVFDDKDKDSTQGPLERGIKDVTVSNGQDVVTTDAKGRYELPVRDNMNVFVTQKAGYEVPVDEDNVAQFSYIHLPEGSPDLKYGGLEPTGDLPEAVNFPMAESAEIAKSEQNCIMGGDVQTYDQEEVEYARDGAFADYVVIPVTNAWVHQEDVDPDLGAIFDPLGNAVHTTLSFPLAGEDVVITGAGPIGVMATAIARHVGARHIAVTDLSDTRLELAKGAGADLLVNAARSDLGAAMRELDMKEGFDVGLEMSGAPPAVADMLDHLNHGGRIAMLGLPGDPYPVDWGKVITHMVTIKGIYGREMYDTWYTMSSMLSTSPVLREAISSVITHRFPAEQWEDAFATAASGECGKVIIDWS